jgi:hypothetical protein
MPAPLPAGLNVETNMSTLIFDGSGHTLTLLDSRGHEVGDWHANNVVDQRATLRFVPNRTYAIIDHVGPHRHGGVDDSLNGKYGRFGIIRLQDFAADGHDHRGVGVHSGRADKGGADHPTMGCIRTTDTAMEAIVQHMSSDALLSITVQNNHVQHNRLPRSRGDHHRGHGAASSVAG